MGMQKKRLRATAPGASNEQPRTRITQTKQDAKNETAERLAMVKHGWNWGGGPKAKTGILKATKWVDSSGISGQKLAKKVQPEC